MGVMFANKLGGVVPALTVSLVVMCATLTTYAQSTSDTSVIEPQYINTFYSVDSTGKLIDLERDTITFRAKSKVLPGYASVKMESEFKPAHASVRLPATAQFIVRGRSQINPASVYELRVLKTSKDRRDFVLTQTHGSVFGATSTSDLDEGAVPIKFQEYGTNSYRIVPEGRLAPGEYALTLRGMVTEIYCFGVDQ
jgi:hypothetical protein